ncbi:hypothetical protein N7468_006337 [Penicillium chermesinum]|uniref:Uncharacterized protein n=1 Tax=Penicillium chermesinum TaxID=63820 RepID=A0A9W9NS26_9EURO|nr:uncharacterized protein N7468_006337 [Penicillium chermesinum]KAJ5225112.1 hypothetical protein N7468_006337 [Penicillium chermesinum]KAJ6151841.1 hypothetical protein N7470_006969 [Penicillium chermesinum]
MYDRAPNYAGASVDAPVPMAQSSICESKYLVVKEPMAEVSKLSYMTRKKGQDEIQGLKVNDGSPGLDMQEAW